MPAQSGVLGGEQQLVESFDLFKSAFSLNHFNLLLHTVPADLSLMLVGEEAEHGEKFGRLVIQALESVHLAVDDALLVSFEFLLVKVLLVECVDKMEDFGFKLDWRVLSTLYHERNALDPSECLPHAHNFVPELLLGAKLLEHLLV